MHKRNEGFSPAVTALPLDSIFSRLELMRYGMRHHKNNKGKIVFR